MVRRSRFRYVLAATIVAGAGSWAVGSAAAKPERLPAARRAGSRLGTAVAVRADGADLAVVGAPEAEFNGRPRGAVYVFSRSFGEWTLQATLLPPPPHEGTPHAEEPDRFGAAVAVDPEGRVILVGAPGHGHDVLHSGAAFLFERSPGAGGGWSDMPAEISPEGAGIVEGSAGCGTSVAVGREFMVVGCPFDGKRGTESGSAFVVSRTISTAVELVPPDGEAHDQFGFSVAIDSRDPVPAMVSLVLVGAPLHPGGSPAASGAAYVFEGPSFSGAVAELAPSDEPRGERFGRTPASETDRLEGPNGFGWSVDLSAEGFGDGAGRAIVGAPGDPDNGPRAGAAYLFRLRPATGAYDWEQLAELTAAGDAEARDRFGSAVSIIGGRPGNVPPMHLGGMVAIGAPFDDDRGPDSGSVYLFGRHQGGDESWGRVAKIEAPDGSAGDRFGQSLDLGRAAGSLNVAAPLLVAGAPFETADAGAPEAGAAYADGSLDRLATFTTIRDSFLRRNRKNTNEGASPLLRIQKRGHNRVVVAFDAAAIDAFLRPYSPEQIERALLALTIERPPTRWSEASPTVSAVPVTPHFEEGNGKDAELVGRERFRGDRPGVTWSCAVDSDTANHRPDCPDPADAWAGGYFGSATAAPVLHRSRQRGETHWDVTEDLKRHVTSWLVKRTDESARGEVQYFSREAAAGIGGPDLAPRLMVEVGPLDELP